MKVDVKFNPALGTVRKAIRAIRLGAALQRYIERAAFTVEGKSKKETPVDTGRLRSSILTDIGTLRAQIAPHTVYAKWIHEGWMIRNGRRIEIKGLGKAGTPPGGKPFMKLGMEHAQKTVKPSKFIEKEINVKLSGVRGI